MGIEVRSTTSPGKTDEVYTGTLFGKSTVKHFVCHSVPATTSDYLFYIDLGTWGSYNI
jgi:hypothetical protein